MSIIHFASAEQRFQGIVSRNDEPSKVHKELASNIEEDEEEIYSDKSEKRVDFRYGRLFFEVVEHRISGQL